MNKVIIPLIIVGGVILTQKTVWANAGDINPEYVRGIIKTIKKLDPMKFGNIPTPLIMGVIATESSFRTKVESSAGAIGLMQVLPSTFAWLKKIYPDAGWQGHGLESPIDNILAGMLYMFWIRQEGGLHFFAEIQAYNTGVSGYKKGSRAVDYATKVLVNSFAFIV